MNKPISLFVAEDYESKKIFWGKIVPVPPEGIMDGDQVSFNLLDENFELFKDKIVNFLIGQPVALYANFHIKRFDIIDSGELLNEDEQNSIEHFLNHSSIAPVIDINLVDEVKERLIQNQPWRSCFKDMSLDLKPERPIKVMLGDCKSYLQFFEDANKLEKNMELFLEQSEIEDFNRLEKIGTVMEARSVFHTQIDFNKGISDKNRDLIICTLFDYMHAMGYGNLPYYTYVSVSNSRISIMSPNFINFQGERMLIRSGLDKQKIMNLYDKLATDYPDLLYKANPEQIRNNINDFVKEQGEIPDDSTKRHNLKK